MAVAHVHQPPRTVAVHALDGSSAFSVHTGGVPGHGWVGVGPAPDALAAAVSTGGLVVAVRGDPADARMRGVVRDAVEAADAGAAVARVMAHRDAAIGAGGPTVWVVSSAGQVGIRLDAREPDRTSPVRYGVGAGAPSTPIPTPDLDALAAALLAVDAAPSQDPAPVEATRALLGAVLEPDATVLVLVGLGTARTAVPLRVWPGHVAGPPLGCSDQHPAALAVAAAAVDTLIAQGRLAPDTVSQGLREVRASALVEAADAERQAVLMAGAGDEAGAMVRRLVAQTHAAAAAERALAALAGRAGGASL